MPPARVVIFDLGGVLIDWDPRHLYRKLLSDDAAIEAFLAEVCTGAWNEMQDAGRSVAQATAALIAERPEHAELIRAYYDRFDEMMKGPLEDTVGVLEDLDRNGVPLYALSNFSSEMFVHARRRFPFLARFRDIVLSGDERLNKPDPRLYRVLLDRYRIDPAEAVFVDDRAPNAAAARALGMRAVCFVGAAELRRELAELGLL